MEDLDAARPQPAGAEAPKEPPKPTTGTSSTGAAPTGGASSKPMSNVNTFASRFGNASKKEDEDEDLESDSDEEGQAFYAGGSETSGQQILGPSKKKEGADFVKHMFKKAREHGAEAVDPGAASGQGPSRPAFTGSGFKLGSTGKFLIYIMYYNLKFLTASKLARSGPTSDTGNLVKSLKFRSKSLK